MEVDRKGKILRRKNNYIQQQAKVGKNEESYIVGSEVEKEKCSEGDTVFDSNFAVTCTSFVFETSSN